MPKHNRKVSLPGLGAQEIYQQVSSTLDIFLSKATPGKFTIDCDDQNRKIHFDASMVKGVLICTDEVVEFDLNLGLMAMPFKGKIDAGIDQWLEKIKTGHKPSGNA